MWKIWGQKLTTANLNGSDLTIYQPVIFGTDVALLGVRTWVVLYNNPTFTDLKLKIYNSNDVLLHTSTNVQLKTDILPDTLQIGKAVEIYFDFDKPSLKGTDNYRFRLEATGYTFSEASHIAWRKGYPDPVYRTNVSLAYGSLMTGPYTMSFVGAEI